MSSEDLLAERALLGDAPARASLTSRVIEPLQAAAGGTLFETAAHYLDYSLGLEATARALFVHPNTVRYRLGRIVEAIGYDLTDAHDAQTVRIALAFHRLGPDGARSVRAARELL